MGHYDNRVAAGKVDPIAGVDNAVDEQIDNTLTRINTKLQEKFGCGTAKSMLTGLEQFEENLEAMDDHRSLLAINSTGQPAQQLASGPSVPAAPQDQLTDDERKFIKAFRDNGVDGPRFLAINKVTLGVTKVDDNGDPTEVAALKAELKKQRETLQNELDKVRQELKDVQDPNKTGSLAHQLDVEKSRAKTNTTSSPTPASPAKDMVEKAKLAIELKPLLEAKKTAKSRLKVTVLEMRKDVFDSLVEKLDALSKK